ncbi:MAG: hypothetical protein JWM71_579 [Solirubrobacteraceae bacterium]|nr:hypothetical protein [Solirubrobacteraceae bacterium]
MVDWRVARKIAASVGGDPGLPEISGDLAEMCADAEQRVSEYAQLTPVTALPAPEAVDRAAWADANLAGMRGVLDPLADKIGKGSGPMQQSLRSVGGLLMGAEVGGLVGLLSQRVMGQYEVPPTDPERPARLLFVTPNLREAARRMEVDEAQMLRWVALHEVTHAVQFSSVPWLRAHVAALVSELAAALDVKFDAKAALKLVDRGELNAAVARLRNDGIVGVVLGPERRALLDRIQATMAMIEGHAEHVMDAAGLAVLPDLAELRAALQRRRSDRNPVMRILEKLMGLEMKMRQYETGKAFCDAVVEQAGVARLNHAWSSAEALPTWAELEDPASWLARAA